jgi:hypothetical protein
MTTKLKEGDIIICLEDFHVAGIVVTFYFYKNRKYIISKYLPLWKTDAWRIELTQGKPKFEETGYFSEDDLFKKFDCVKYQRRKKLKKINENNCKLF